MFNRIINRRAQIGEAITWVVATVIIAFILTISLFIASFYLGNNKNIQQYPSYDVLISNSFYSYLLTKAPTGDSVYTQIKTAGNLNEFNGKLGQNVFNLFDNDYENTWLGATDQAKFSPPISNKYFLPNRGFGELPYKIPGSIGDEIMLDQNKTIAFSIMPKTSLKNALSG